MTKHMAGKIDCPDCDGEGYTERMTGLTYDGAQTWETETCERCDGSGEVDEEEEEEEEEEE